MGDTLAIARQRTLPPLGRRALRYAGIAALLVLGFLVALLVADAGALALLTAIALGLWLTTVSWLRRPVGTLTVLVGATAFEGTIRAYTSGVFPVAKLADALLVSAMFATLWRYVTGARKGSAGWWPGLWLLAAYLFGTLLSVPFSPMGAAAPDGFRRTMLLTTIIFPMAYIQWPAAVRLKALKCIAGVAIAVAAYAAFRKVTGPSVNEAALANQYEVVNGKAALFSPMMGRQDLAGWIAVVVPTLLVLTLMLKSRWRIACALGTVALGGELFFTQTRVGLVALVASLAAGALLLIGSQAQAKYRATIGVVLIVCAVGGVAGYTATIGGSREDSQRYSGILHPNQDASAVRHRQKWQQTIQDLKGHPFGFGVGAAGTANRAHGRFINQDTYFIDSSYLELAYQQGFGVAIVFFVAVLFIMYALASTALRAADRLDAGIAAAACAGFVGWLVLLTTGSFNERWCTLYVFMLAGLAAAPALTPIVARDRGE